MKSTLRRKLSTHSLALLVCAFVSTTVAKQETIPEKDLRVLLDLLAGEFNNYNQVNFQENDYLDERPDTNYSRLHHKRELINSDKLDGHWLYAQINRLDRDGEIYRQSYMQFFIDDTGKIKSRAYQLVQDDDENKSYPSKTFLNTLGREQLEPRLPSGCDASWHRELNQFIGITNPDTCLIDSKYKNEKRRIFSQDIVGVRGFWGREGAYNLKGKLAFGLEAPNYFRYHRARPMQCWAAVHLGDDDWEFYRNLKTHDQGGTISFGKQREYRLQLKQTEFPVGEWSNVFEIFLYRKDEEKAFSYSWTEPEAKHIAVNLREVQASCKLASQ